MTEAGWMSFDDFNKFIEGMEKPFWEPIGHYIFRFGMLERKVDEALSDLMGADYFRVGMYPLSEIDFLARAKLMNVFCRNIQDGSVQDAMKQTVLGIETQNTFRNTLVHGPWLAFIDKFEGEHGAWQKMNLSRRYNLATQNLTVSEINSNRAKVEHLIFSVKDIAFQALQSRAASTPLSNKS